MFYNYYQDGEYNFDSCIAKGMCSADPTISSLQEVIIMYIKQLSFYTLRLKRKGVSNPVIKDNIINTLAGLVSHTDYTQEQFKNIIMTVYENLRQSKILYERLCKNNNKSTEKLEADLKINKKFDLNEAIKQGEKEFIRKNKFLDSAHRHAFEIMFVLIKNVCINLIQLKSYNIENDQAYYSMLHILSLMNYKKISVEYLKKVIEDFSAINFRLEKLLHDAETECFGEQETVEVSFSTRNGKAILVSGSNLKELEDVLKATNGTNIDVYTHGSMIMGHTYPKLKAYKQLRGQFGLGVENCLLDFATFPGAILMTKNSLQNIEYLYRGRLFTTDLTVPKGVTQIKEKDFQPLIKSALEAKGFAKGQLRDSLKIGYQKDILASRVNEVLTKITSRNIKHLLILGILNQSSLQKRYFSKLLKNLPKDTHAITLSTYTPSTNTFQINSSYDFMLIYQILEDLKSKITDKTFDISVFLTKCDKYAISNMLNLKHLGVKNIFISHCSPVLINPMILDAFRDTFDVKIISTPKNDLDYLRQTA